ncbi:MAG TPA: hypothetical protein VFX86_03615 [Candidatus Saccharimonadales bacterium]|nr:hypothetical protein [Candidatus Saccharimonadales bacterium]
MGSVPTPETTVEHRRDITRSFVDSLEPDEAINAYKIADDINAGGEPLASTVVIIPVAAHQEAGQIEHALAEYGKQASAIPFSIVLGLNSPAKEQDGPEVQATMEAIDSAREHNPGLDVRTTFSPYKKPVIGRIRRDLWNGAVIAASQDEHDEFGGDSIGINHDIDLVRLSGGFMGRVQEYYHEAGGEEHAYSPLPIMGTQTYHEPSPDHPNSSKAVAWFDYIARAAGGSYEAGTVIPLSAYADRGGFDSGRTEREVIGFLNSRDINLIRGTLAATSPRRFIHNLDRLGYDVWAEGSFLATDGCRTAEAPPDITAGRLIEIVDSTLRFTPDNLILGQIKRISRYMLMLRSDEPELFEAITHDDSLFMDQINAPIDRIRIVSERILSRMIKRSYLAKKMQRRMNQERVDELARPYFMVLTGIEPESSDLIGQN